MLAKSHSQSIINAIFWLLTIFKMVAIVHYQCMCSFSDSACTANLLYKLLHFPWWTIMNYASNVWEIHSHAQSISGKNPPSASWKESNALCWFLARVEWWYIANNKFWGTISHSVGYASTPSSSLKCIKSRPQSFIDLQ